jgi:pimeloyl-ACP methyl ester carboxylesterase
MSELGPAVKQRAVKLVRSADGTKIAFETTGEGAPLILVGGAFCDRHAKASGTPFAALLAPHARVISYDRRGRGGSTDTRPYAIEREIEDLSALLGEVGAASLYGISSGGVLAIEAALRGLPISGVVAYEPPLIVDAAQRPPESVAVELEALSAAGRRSEAAELFLTRSPHAWLTASIRALLRR